MIDAADLFASAVADIVSPGTVTLGQMFGKPCAKLDGKAFIARQGEVIAFKLTGDWHARALASPGAGLWDPSGKGRPMREWVAVPAPSLGDGASLAQAAHDFVQNAKRPS